MSSDRGTLFQTETRKHRHELAHTYTGAFAFFYVLSAVLLAKATQTLPIGTAYPVWTGIGALGSVLVGIFIFHEPATFWRLFFITTLTASIIGLKMVS